MASNDNVQDLAFDLENLEFNTEADCLRSAKIILNSKAVSREREKAYDMGWKDAKWWYEAYAKYKETVRNMGMKAAQVMLPPPVRPVNPWRSK